MATLKGYVLDCRIFSAVLTSLTVKANILIDETHHARLADFGLLTIISDPANLVSSSSCPQGGTVRWMSPELVVPEKYGFEKSRLTPHSDCYALGMVIYETVSGNVPFHEHIDAAVFVKVMLGEHPTRGAMFPEYLWKVMESCWASTPEDRPSIESILWSLQMTSDPSSGPCGETGVDNDDWNILVGSSVIESRAGDSIEAGRACGYS